MTPLPPSRELDAAVAEALGWRIPNPYVPLVGVGFPTPDSFETEIPRYSIDIAAAFDCLAALEIKGLRWGIDNYDGVINVRIWEPEGDEYLASSEANTAPHAICLAFLKAKGGK